jgi:ribosomal protein L27
MADTSKYLNIKKFDNKFIDFGTFIKSPDKFTTGTSVATGTDAAKKQASDKNVKQLTSATDSFAKGTSVATTQNVNGQNSDKNVTRLTSATDKLVLSESVEKMITEFGVDALKEYINGK